MSLLYPHPCGTCGCPRGRDCERQRVVVDGRVLLVECDGSDGE